MAKQFIIPAGKRQCVLWVFSSSIPGQSRFTAEPLDGDTLTGTVEVRRWHWFHWRIKEYPLAQRNVFDKGFGDADFRIFVTPDQDCRITFQTRHFRAEAYFLLLAALLGLGFVAGLIAVIFAPT